MNFVIPKRDKKNEQKNITLFGLQPARDPPIPTILGMVIDRDQPNSREKMRDFTVDFLKCAQFHGTSMRNSRKIHGPTAVISRCYVNTN